MSSEQLKSPLPAHPVHLAESEQPDRGVIGDSAMPPIAGSLTFGRDDMDAQRSMPDRSSLLAAFAIIEGGHDAMAAQSDVPTDADVMFRSIVRADVGLLAGWLSQPHVRPWFYDSTVDEAFVLRSYEAVLQGTTSKRGFVIVVDGRDVGYAETYLGEDHEAFFAGLDVEATGTAGCDLLLGDPAFVGRGIGSAVIRQFTSGVIFSDVGVARAIAGPDLRNERSQRAFARAGYKVLHHVQVPGDTAPAVVMEALADVAG